MNVCIIGDGLTSLSLAKNLINQKIIVHMFHKTKKNKLFSNRAIGISKNNLEFFQNKILKINKKHLWKIDKIEIFSEKIKDSRILNFEKEKNFLFSMIKNEKLYGTLNKNLLKNSLFKKKIIKNNYFYKKILKEKKYDLIINCESKNYFEKKFFYKKIVKDYKNLAYTTIFQHSSIKNNTATQIFTKYGPIAFLPLSDTKTSVVYSVNLTKSNLSQLNILNLIKKYNPKYSIKSFDKINKFNLKLSNARNYYHKNIIGFGECIHKIHPLAGQGFNMTVRDIKIISEIIENKVSLGLQLDESICEDFEIKTKHLNFIFSNSIDFIYEFFNIKRKNQNLDKIVKILGSNKKLKNMFTKYADKGISI
jgi:2-octaprenyl-6-methoxyphenol hydroxylase